MEKCFLYLLTLMFSCAMPDEKPVERHILSLIVDNEAGALGRVVSLFSGRGYNIDSLTVSEIEHQNHLSRITVTTLASSTTVAHIVTLLERLVPVHEVRNLSSQGPFIEKALLLIKINAPEAKRSELLHLASEFSAQEVDITDESFVFQLTDIPEKVNEFIALLTPYGIIELARTGITAMARGKEGF